jgi:hypothetical protein
MGFCLVAQTWTYKKLVAHRNCPKIFHGPSQITPAHPSSYFMTGPLFIILLFSKMIFETFSGNVYLSRAFGCQTAAFNG